MLKATSGILLTAPPVEFWRTKLRCLQTSGGVCMMKHRVGTAKTMHICGVAISKEVKWHDLSTITEWASVEPTLTQRMAQPDDDDWAFPVGEQDFYGLIHSWTFYELIRNLFSSHFQLNSKVVSLHVLEMKLQWIMRYKPCLKDLVKQILTILRLWINFPSTKCCSQQSSKTAQRTGRCKKYSHQWLQCNIFGSFLQYFPPPVN